MEKKRLEALERLARLDEELGIEFKWPDNQEIDGLKLVCTCGACPEQYDVFDGDKKVGYLRLRHGHFRCDYPDCGGETIYHSDTKGDGIFDDDERMPELKRVVAAIRERMGRDG
jgi:hypothetical protein